MPLCWFCLTVQSVPSFFPPITWMRLKFSVTASPSWSAEASNAVVRPSTSKTSWLRATTLPSQRRYMCVSVSVTPTEFLLEFNSHKKNQGSTGVQYNGIILIPRYIDIHKHSTFGVGKSFSMFFKEVFYAHQGSIYLIKNRVKCNTMKFFFPFKYFFLFKHIFKCDWFLWWQSWIFSIITVSSVTWSFRNHSKADLLIKKHSLLLSMLLHLYVTFKRTAFIWNRNLL